MCAISRLTGALRDADDRVSALVLALTEVDDFVYRATEEMKP